ncbi:hypothetical protein LTR37_017557 [Vermiconidia calcicola]|uniref:Uncharacterized protein n=1 Tax=Vermiconidia calcicola TaxID=1690605 RepID=A0ACC3ML66_9PEZI|nr:hypothetical protein LTR37_017557 [Vermiconidia calcicola]
MCKTWTLTYTCTHTRLIRLSKCRGTVTIQPKATRDPKAACHSTPILTLHARTACGECERAKVEKELLEALSAVQARSSAWIVDPKVAAAQEEYDQQIHALWKRIPGKQFKKYARPEKGECTTYLPRRTSLLGREVRVEDVVVMYETNKTAVGGGWDWEAQAGDYSSLADEIAEREGDVGMDAGEDFVLFEDQANPMVSPASTEDEDYSSYWTSESTTDSLINDIEAECSDPWVPSTEMQPSTISTSTPLRDVAGNEAASPPAPRSAKVVPPHERRRQRKSSSSSVRYKAAPSAEDETTKLDLPERLRCFSFGRVMTVSS